jgi:hypothetical protein
MNPHPQIIPLPTASKVAWLVLAIVTFTTSSSQAGDPYRGHPHHPQAGVAVGPEMYPVTTAAYRPQSLGTFRSSPSLYVSSGYTSGGAYSAISQYPNSASLAVYGPTSLLRPASSDVVLYSRGYDGRLYPTSVGTSITYPNLSPLNTPELEVNPFRNRVNYFLPSAGSMYRERLGPYPLGEN